MGTALSVCMTCLYGDGLSEAVLVAGDVMGVGAGAVLRTSVMVAVVVGATVMGVDATRVVCVVIGTGAGAVMRA